MLELTTESEMRVIELQ